MKKRIQGSGTLHARLIMTTTARFTALSIAVLVVMVLTAAERHAVAQDTTHGALVLSTPHTFATAPGAPTAGGYLMIMNTGDEDDRLTGGSVTFADKVEVHQMSMDGDVMRMRRVKDGLTVPAKGSLHLKRGGYHIMFIGLNDQLKPGESHDATLHFEKAGEVKVTFQVNKLTADHSMNHGKAEKHSHGDMKKETKD